ncbi:binding--dependent transport system inner membrane component family protein [Fusobacterium necrophorum subsp. funduliforme B35]|uniref:ABC transporter permease n=1 Tax=Fusobacterium necrophorum subsp. funduliforme B35 TaxID=1226633 RepID=A0A017H8P3_9FUSO|nr:ABC transporter permease [Fusobacterium necrophorum]EYD70144.1 binding--dependent transport system inner membrane component family protein [Fusobacterium necrophorum subsp. funduliforme B35]KID49387.1 ABC transporter permease [Fusobacterium necrophorum subsp. funduliforme B35]
MKKYVIIVFQKILRCLLLLLGVSILSFILLKNSPVDPVMASVNYDVNLTPEQYQKIAEYYGLDKPVVTQYFLWLKNFIRGDFGVSLVHRKPVMEMIRMRAGASAALMGISWFLSGIFGFTLGTIAAFKREKLMDRIIKWFSYLQVTVPTFWIGLIFLLIFSVQLKWLPIGISTPIGRLSTEVDFADKIRHLILPVFTLSVLGIANVTLHTREKMLDVLNSEYVLFAKARGESTFVIFKHHGIRNAIVPAITIHFSYFGELFGGSVLAEQVFSYPGLGSTLTEAGLKSDTPLLLAIVMIGAVFVFLGNTIADILNSILNPNLRREV